MNDVDDKIEDLRTDISDTLDEVEDLRRRLAILERRASLCTTCEANRLMDNMSMCPECSG